VVSVDLKIEWIGYDLMDLGGGSLILDGVYYKQELFKDFYCLINSNGIFSINIGNENCNNFIERFKELGENGEVELLYKSKSRYAGPELIKIGKPLELRN